MQLLHLVGRRGLPLGDALETLQAGLLREPPRPRRRGRGRHEDSLARLAPGADAVGEGGARRPAVAVAGKAEEVGDGVVVLGRGQREGGGVRRGSIRRRGRLAGRRGRRQDPGERRRQHHRRESMSHGSEAASARRGRSVALRGRGSGEGVLAAGRQGRPRVDRPRHVVLPAPGEPLQVDHAGHHVRQRLLHGAHIRLQGLHVRSQLGQVSGDYLELRVPRCSGPDETRDDDQECHRWRELVEPPRKYQRNTWYHGQREGAAGAGRRHGPGESRRPAYRPRVGWPREGSLLSAASSRTIESCRTSWACRLDPGKWRPQRDSNPCLSLERAES